MVFGLLAQGHNSSLFPAEFQMTLELNNWFVMDGKESRQAMEPIVLAN